MRWKFALLDPDIDLPERFEGTAEEAARFAVKIPIPSCSNIVTASDGPLTESPDYPAGWTVRQVKFSEERRAYVVEADSYDHGVVQRNPTWLISYFVSRLRTGASPCVFEVRASDGRLLQVVIAEDNPFQAHAFDGA